VSEDVAEPVTKVQTKPKAQRKAKPKGVAATKTVTKASKPTAGKRLRSLCSRARFRLGIVVITQVIFTRRFNIPNLMPKHNLHNPATGGQIIFVRVNETQ